MEEGRKEGRREDAFGFGLVWSRFVSVFQVLFFLLPFSSLSLPPLHFGPLADLFVLSCMYTFPLGTSHFLSSTARSLSKNEKRRVKSTLLLSFLPTSPPRMTQSSVSRERAPSKQHKPVKSEENERTKGETKSKKKKKADGRKETRTKQRGEREIMTPRRRRQGGRIS